MVFNIPQKEFAPFMFEIKNTRLKEFEIHQLEGIPPEMIGMLDSIQIQPKIERIKVSDSLSDRLSFRRLVKEKDEFIINYIYLEISFLSPYTGRLEKIRSNKLMLEF